MPSEAGPHPDDPTLFHPDALPRLRRAVDEYGWLLGHDYAPESALKLVGDHHQLEARQRLAVRRVSCGEPQRERRARHQVPPLSARAQPLWIDGFNLLITLATAQRGGLLLRGRDGALRDLASSHRLVLRTAEMLGPLAELLAEAPPTEVHWVLDRPVSNSDRVGQMIVEFASAHGLPWTYRLEYNPDTFLLTQDAPVVTSDAMILDGASTWIDLLSPLVARLPDAWVVQL